MSYLKVDIDTSSLTKFFDNFVKEIDQDLTKGIKGLAISTHAHIIEEAGKKLNKQDREKYLESVSTPNQINSYLWEITLSESGMKIEEGRDAWDTKGVPGQWGLLKNPTGHTKDGKAYKIIPMEQGKVFNSYDPKKLDQHKEMVNNIKTFLKSKNIPTRGVESHTIIDPQTGRPKKTPILSAMNDRGFPKPIHSFNIPSKIPGKGNTPQLHGLNIYQVKNEKTGKVSRVMTTFRTAVEGDGKWMHKAMPGADIFDETGNWASNQWDNVWINQILRKYE